jgi:hypothetical protein
VSRERAITVWDSPEDRDRFLAERLAPAYHALGRSLDELNRCRGGGLISTTQGRRPHADARRGRRKPTVGLGGRVDACAPEAGCRPDRG